MIANNNYDELEIIKLGRWCGKWPVIKTHSAEICVPTHPSVETSSFNNIIINSKPFQLYHHEASLALGYHKSPEFHTWFHKMFKRNAWSLQKCWEFKWYHNKISFKQMLIKTYCSSISEYFQNHNGLGLCFSRIRCVDIETRSWHTLTHAPGHGHHWSRAIYQSKPHQLTIGLMSVIKETRWDLMDASVNIYYKNCW